MRPGIGAFKPIADGSFNGCDAAASADCATLAASGAGKQRLDIRTAVGRAVEANGMTIGTQAGRVPFGCGGSRERARGNFRMFFIPNGMKPAGNRAPNLPILMEPRPIQSDRQRLLVAYSDMPPSKRCRLGPPNPHPKIVKFSNQPGDFLNALKQSLFTTTNTHKRYLNKTTRSAVHCEHMRFGNEFSNARGILFAERRMPQANAERGLARQQTSRLNGSPAKFACGQSPIGQTFDLPPLARPQNANHWPTITRRSAARSDRHQHRRARTRGQTNVTWQKRTMTRYDALVLLSLAGVFAAYCITIAVLFPL